MFWEGKNLQIYSKGHQNEGFQRFAKTSQSDVKKDTKNEQKSCPFGVSLGVSLRVSLGCQHLLRVNAALLGAQLGRPRARITLWGAHGEPVWVQMVRFAAPVAAPFAASDFDGAF